jgi:CDGSH-type Zn-finger protein
VDERVKRMKIAVTEGGPYQVRGDVPLVRLAIETNADGESVGYREIGRVEGGERYLLCRCGRSASKPFCDWSHAEADFVGEETAGHEPYTQQAVSIDGPGVVLKDARKLCAEARFCDRAGGLWNLVGECSDEETRALAEEEARLCPSGRYVLCDQESDLPLEPELEPSIAIIEDPHLGVSGPLFVRGGIPIVDSQGTQYEVRNRVTLCRCGHSNNKPFCDGSHVRSEFRDESAP